MSSIPQQVADVYDPLKTEVTWLHARWICYRQLYAESPRRIDLLNECASAFFYIIQDVLLDEVQVCLSKLTDPAQSGKFENLSLEQLQHRLEMTPEVVLAQNTRTILDQLQQKCSPFRIWRNKKLAHLDLLTAMKATPDPLPGVSRQMIEDALASTRDYLNAIERHYNDSEIGYENFVMSSDGEALAAILRYGLRYEELLQERRISYDDWRKSAWYEA